MMPCSARACTSNALPPHRIGRAGDLVEREADRLADAALRRPGPAALPRGADAAERSLDSAERAFFEPRFGHDFGSVRLHADARAAAAAASLHARAFTLRSDIVFGAGQYRPTQREGRALIAHELAHVVQAARGGADTATLRRAPPTTAGRNIDFIDRIYGFQFAISAEPAAFADTIGRIEPGAVDLTERPVLERDVFTLTPRFSEGGDLTGALRWELPPELKRVRDVGDHGIHVRVCAGTKPSIVEAKVGANDSPRMMTVKIAIEALPADASAIDPRLQANVVASAAVKEERRSSREQYRALEREQRREQRAERREERRSLRSQARVLRRERRLLERDCDARQQALIDTALTRAIEVCSAAIVSAQRGAQGDARLQGALERYMKIAAADASSPSAPKVLQLIVDTLAVARNSMLTSTHESFDCVSCQENTGAFVTSEYRAGSTLSLCPKWLNGNALTFDPVSGVDEARAYALLHEFIHLAGPGKDPEKYVSDDEWETVTAADALGMADAYAALAWTVGGAR
ncbi:MAG: eCIS core domain-containing protein [Burkholderiales bacterium]